MKREKNSSAPTRRSHGVLRPAVIAATLVTVCGVPSLAAGGSSLPDPQPTPQISPEERADQHYNRGLKLRDRAKAAQDKMTAAKDDKGRARHGKKAEKLFRQAAKQFREAIKLDREHYQAYSSLGYALRNVGEHDDALGAYNQALKLNPSYTEAIEYRAQAYMHLGQIEQTKQAYMQLFREDRAKADTLMAAMKKWIEQQQEQGSSDAQVQELSTWISEREQIAQQARLVPEVSASEQEGW